ncbi:MAG: ArsR family transcriptional regulator [Pseudomonadota bacterium]|nr:ArsR family transcriptional regulator [Pseudomonadota bacterium]
MSAPDFATHLSEDRRLVLLRILAEMPGYRSNSSVLRTLLERWGHTPSRDQVVGDLVWLQEQGLLSGEQLGSVLVATLTERGHDVATGRARVPGVARPGA